MNIKSILLGSAAALVAVSGARAADAVVMVEPEPVEYVRVCDVYGTGFFYIPGTETCLKIGGYVRMRLETTGKVSGNADFQDATNLDGDQSYDFHTRVRARLNFDAREETELGTLRSFIRLQATNTSFQGDGFGTANNGVSIDQAYIQLGGLTIGKLDSLWAERDGLLTDNDWSVGDITNNRISYTYAANGFTGAVSLEDDGDGDFTPDIVAQLAYEGGWGTAYISGIYDEDAFSSFGYRSNIVDFNGNFIGTSRLDDYTTSNASDGAFALKAGVELKDLIAADSVFKIEGHYAFDPTEYASLEPGGYLGGANTLALPSEYQIGAAYQQSFGKLTAIVSGVYGRLFDVDFDTFDGNGLPITVSFDGSDYYGVAGNLSYQLTSNFSVSGEISYRDVDSSVVRKADQTFGYIEFKRDF